MFLSLGILFVADALFMNSEIIAWPWSTQKSIYLRSTTATICDTFPSIRCSRKCIIFLKSQSTRWCHEHFRMTSISGHKRLNVLKSFQMCFKYRYWDITFFRLSPWTMKSVEHIEVWSILLYGKWRYAVDVLIRNCERRKHEPRSFVLPVNGVL